MKRSIFYLFDFLAIVSSRFAKDLDRFRVTRAAAFDIFKTIDRICYIVIPHKHKFYGV